MTGTDDLAVRLLAAIEETERIAREAADAHFHFDARDDHFVARGLRSDQIVRHIIRQDPKATLIRCAADRKIVGLHRTDDRSGWLPDHSYGEIDPACSTCGSQDLAVEWPCDTLRAIAEGYGVTP